MGIYSFSKRNGIYIPGYTAVPAHRVLIETPEPIPYVLKIRNREVKLPGYLRAFLGEESVGIVSHGGDSRFHLMRKRDIRLAARRFWECTKDRDFMTMFSGDIYFSDITKRGTLRIPERVMDNAGLADEAVFVRGNHLDIRVYHPEYAQAVI